MVADSVEGRGQRGGQKHQTVSIGHPQDFQYTQVPLHAPSDLVCFGFLSLHCSEVSVTKQGTNRARRSYR